VLDFGLAKESDGGFFALTPKVGIRETQGIKEFNSGVGLSSNGNKVIFTCTDDRSRSTTLGGDESGGRSQSGSKKKEFRFLTEGKINRTSKYM